MRERTHVYIRLVATGYRFCTGQVLHHDGVMRDAVVQEYILLPGKRWYCASLLSDERFVVPTEHVALPING